MPSIPHQNDSQNPKTKRNPNPKILSFILKSTIMLLAISFFLLFIGIAALAVLHLLLSRPHRRPPSASRGVAISLEDLQRCLPGFVYTSPKRGDLEKEGEERCCAVCLEGYREGEMCRRLPGCCHVYHSRCVDMWLAKVLNCPVCRTRVRIEREDGSGVGSWEDGNKVLWSSLI